MGIYEDVMASLTGGARRAGEYVMSGQAEQDFLSNTAMGRYATYNQARQQLEDYAESQGWDRSKDPLGAQLQRDFPDEFAAVESLNPAGNIALSAAGAPRALTPPRAVGEVIPPQTGGSMPPPSASRAAPGPVIDGQVVSASSRPVGSTPPPPTPPSPASASPSGSLPSAGGASQPPSAARGNPNPIGTRPPFAAGPAGSTLPPPPGMLSRAAAAARAHPFIAGAAGIGTALGIGALINGGAGQPADASPDGFDPRYMQDQPMMPGRDLTTQDEALAEANRQKDLERRQSEAEVASLEALTAKAQAEAKQLEQAMAQSDMTESEKAQARKDLQELQDRRAAERNDADIRSRERITAATEAGATSRNAADNQSRERITGMTEAGANQRTATTEAGANTRSAYQGGVEMRGQDLRDREAGFNFAVQSVANDVANGKLSVEKANKMISDYVSMAKLPTDILKQVSDSIQPFLPYMTNRSMGESAPGFEKGGSMEQLVKMGGGKYDPSKYKATSDFNLMDIAAQYGGGPPSTPPKQLDVQGIYDAIPTPRTQNLTADEYRAQYQGDGHPARPQMGGGQQIPPMVQNMMPQTVTPPMGDDVQQRILAGLGQ